ncbi:glutathione S-transferase family protein [Caulobacter sp.]|uniref:glutathione S-transferase family protein n=1 Tax=Caulobacter sp. TaxID=78 RepID=UPI003BAB9212
MSLTLYFHPLSSFCWKALIGLYENDTPFTPRVVDLGDETSRAAFLAVWPVGKFPVLRDDARRETVPETSVILDYLDAHHPGSVRFTSADPDAAWRTRLWDRFFDLYIHIPMQKIVGDRIRPSDADRDPFGVAQARGQIAASYAVLEAELADRAWMSAGDTFGLADCAAFPALFYADKVQPLGETWPRISAYLARLKARPSAARVLEEAEPYFRFFPAG